MSLSAYHHLAKAGPPGAPLVFAFHGTGGDEHQFFGLIEQILPQAGIVSPRGDVSEHGANRFFRRTGEGVYDMADLALRTAKMAGFIAAHKAANPGAPVYGLGYSNGANILASVVLEAPDLFERVVLMHPLIPWQPAPNAGLRGKKVLITAGRQDPICPLPLTQSLDHYFKTQGSAVDLFLHDGGHEVRQPELTAIAAFLKA
ncbi:alpha/beta hydrolase [bacterium]|nr:alpha/beta hydrolase [bacterium]